MFKNENYVDNYTDLENIAYGIILVIHEVRELRKQNAELLAEVNMHNKRIRDKINQDQKFFGELLKSLVDIPNSEEDNYALQNGEDETPSGT